MEADQSNSDQDELTDDKEIYWQDRGLTGLEWRSNPEEEHTDRDGLNDSVEVEGWDVHVDMKNGVPYRWNPDSTETMGAFGNPRKTDTDGDGIDDYLEKTELHTHPATEDTYLITEEHEELVNELGRRNKIREAHFMGVPREIRSQMHDVDVELTDATDDYDFVYPDTGIGMERVLFKSIDGVTRTDTWFSNKQELGNGTDPWDPVMDNDGLTDGQEVKWVTREPKSSQGFLIGFDRDLTDILGLNIPKDPDINMQTIHVDPVKNDTDNDGAPDYTRKTKVIGGWKLGGVGKQGEILDLNTDPFDPTAFADVLVARDEEYINVHPDKQYVRKIVRKTNGYFDDEFPNSERASIGLRIVDWTTWQSNNSLEGKSTTKQRKSMVERLNWPENDRGADVLSGFSGQGMARDSIFASFADATSNDEIQVTLVGIEDITDVYRNNLYQHEIGHVYGAEHPKDDPNIPDGTPGIMCKSALSSCLYEGNMLTTNDWSDGNHQKIKSNRIGIARATTLDREDIIDLDSLPYG